MPYDQEDRGQRAAFHRRDALAGTAAVGGYLGFQASLLELAAQAAAKPEGTEFEAALKKIIGDATPAEGKLTLEMPEIAESGNMVPYTVSAASPMTEKDFVKALHELATSNPQPGIASFSFTPASGAAFVASRMRLSRSQEVVAVAELSDGRFLVGRRSVKVTIGGCGG